MEHFENRGERPSRHVALLIFLFSIFKAALTSNSSTGSFGIGTVSVFGGLVCIFAVMSSIRD